MEEQHGTMATREAMMEAQQPTIYPTLVVGLGGTGTNVVRYVKRRFARTWGGDELDELPSVLQLMAIDTEPLVNAPGDEPLYPHEFAFLGKYDATRLIQNRANHAQHHYLDWWQYDDGDLPLGYIHNGAKQLRPIGRLSFVRNYPVFKTMLQDKLAAMNEHRGIHTAQERGFPVEPQFKLIYVVSSLCGGTGAGMFLDVAHCIRHYVKSDARIVGIFLMPSVFEHEVRSDLQRRRIQANAYAALRELNHFHTSRGGHGFQGYYPTEQTPIPTTRHRAFNQVFLVERSSVVGRTLTHKANAEQMTAHLIHLTAFSHLNKRILGLDVNVTEERSGSDGKYLSYSSFGTSALVLPRTALWRYFVELAIYWTIYFLRSGTGSPVAPGDGDPDYRQIRDRVREEFSRHLASQGDLHGLADDMTQGSGRWRGFRLLLVRQMKEILQRRGLDGLKQVLERLALERNSEALTRANLYHESQQPPMPGGNGRLLRWIEYPFLFGRRGRQRRREHELAERRKLADAVWIQLLGKLRDDARRWLDQLTLLGTEVEGAQTEAEAAASQALASIDPFERDGSTETSTYYDLETGAFGNDVVEGFNEAVTAVLGGTVQQDDSEQPILRHLGDAVLGELLRNHDNPQLVLGQADLRGLVEDALLELDLRDRVRAAFDLRSVVHLQYPRRPPNFRLDQLMMRLGAHAAVDGDTWPYSEAVQEHAQLIGTPAIAAEEQEASGRALRQALRGYSQFEWVATGDGDRIDACHIVHGLPLGQLESLPGLKSQYDNDHDFPKKTLHTFPGEFEQMEEIYWSPISPNGAGGTATPPAARQTRRI
jgi:hypothetical protein